MLWLYRDNGDKPVYGVSWGAPGYGYIGVVWITHLWYRLSGEALSYTGVV